MVSSSSTHTHTPRPLWHADGVRQPGEEGGDGDYGWGEQGPSSPHLLHAETTQKALSLPPPWQQIRTVCLDGWRHRGVK